MEIKVTSCADCPFATDEWLECFLTETTVSENIAVETLHPSCPLKQQSITVKLDQEYQKQKQ